MLFLNFISVYSSLNPRYKYLALKPIKPIPISTSKIPDSIKSDIHSPSINIVLTLYRHISDFLQSILRIFNKKVILYIILKDSGGQ